VGVASLAQAQAIECFHLAFVQTLTRRLNQQLYVLKGGANLRYFFDSHRYSEDIDFDAVKEPWKLTEGVDDVLASPTIAALLRTTGVSLARVAKPKQTETTQRWKVMLAVAGREEQFSTRIEFSRRNGERRWLLEAVPDRIVAPYALRPPTLLHYTAAPAIEQKIRALALRMETQARDVFDLELLFRGHRDAASAGMIDKEILEAAVERCLELPREAFEAQVMPFLDPDVAQLYEDPASWEQMQSFVVDRLMELE
jgi:predicted nucleotidyltransferase component of viral defense system